MLAVRQVVFSLGAEPLSSPHAVSRLSPGSSISKCLRFQYGGLSAQIRCAGLSRLAASECRYLISEIDIVPIDLPC